MKDSRITHCIKAVIAKNYKLLLTSEFFKTLRKQVSFYGGGSFRLLSEGTSWLLVDLLDTIRILTSVFKL